MVGFARPAVNIHEEFHLNCLHLTNATQFTPLKQVSPSNNHVISNNLDSASPTIPQWNFANDLNQFSIPKLRLSST